VRPPVRYGAHVMTRRSWFALTTAMMASSAWAQEPPPTETPYSNDDQFQSITIMQDEADGPADADGRRELRARGAYGKGVVFSTVSDSFAVQLRARFQLQAAGLFPEVGPARIDLQVRRMRLLLTGHALGRRLTYYLQLGFSERDLERDSQVPLRDAFVTWHVHPAFNLRLGQMKIFFDRQRVTSSSALQMVERAEVVNELNLDRDIGVQVLGRAGRFSYAAGIFTGEGRNRVNPDVGLLYFANAQVLPLGDVDFATETDLARTPAPRVALSVAGAYNQRARRDRSSQGAFFSTGAADFLHLSANAIFFFRGLSLSGEFLSRQTLATHGGLELSALRDGRGAFGQGGYLLTRQWEVTARAGHLWPLAVDSMMPASTELTVGLNHYVVAHDLKVQLNSTAFLRAPGNEYVVRAQLQAFF